MPILHVSKTYIHFLHEKMGRKISKGNAPAVAAQKMPFGIRILVRKQMFATITQAHLSLLRM